MKTDIQIAQEATLQPIKEVAATIGIEEEDLELYGKYKAKISDELIARSHNNPDGKLILVTAINPTPAGEGKTTVTVGLGQAFAKLGKKAMIALREPSLGPCFGIKGGAAGGGYSQVVPMEDLNLHFTGDFHAITSANNLLAALLDNHIQQGNTLGIDPRQVVWKRCLDMNDRVLRNVVVGLGNKMDGMVREDHFVITVASEIMAILCLAEDTLGAALCSSGAAQNLLAMTSSHFCAAERQFRTPLSYGAVRTPTAQWTATAAGCCLLRPAGQGVGVAAATLGRVQDYNIKDINNMGAAMAPAAAATLLHYLADTHAELRDFDCIYTGDLGLVGSQMLRELLAAEGLLLKNHADCGCLLYDAGEQRVKSGGSGAGCCAAVLCAHILPKLLRRGSRRVLFLATGALMSQTTFLQKESIPAVAHLVELTAPEKES